MGNTVARSHIRDADRGVARVTRANTRKNSAPPPPTNDPPIQPLSHPLFSHAPPLLQPPPIAPSPTAPATATAPAPDADVALAIAAKSDTRPRRVAFETSHSFTYGTSSDDHEIDPDNDNEHHQDDPPLRRGTTTPSEHHMPQSSNNSSNLPLSTLSASTPAPSDTPILRALQTSRVHTPPRVDKPPRARKVVSFNENVAVLTYPQEESTHSSDTPLQDIKPTRKKGRAMFRLLQKPPPVPDADNPMWVSSCFTSQYDACCGLRIPHDPPFDEASLLLKRPSTIQHHRDVQTEDRLSFSSSQDMYDDADLVVSFERTKHIALRRQEDPFRSDNVVDDFDYTERRSSANEDTLSLSDAHPSRDAIDEPEAIGDQLLTVQEVKEELRNNSSFDIAPLWQRLKRVDELDSVRSSKRSAKLGRPRKDTCRPCDDSIDIDVDVDAPSLKLTKAIAADRVDDTAYLDEQIGPLLAERWARPTTHRGTRAREKRIRRSASVGSPSHNVDKSLKKTRSGRSNTESGTAEESDAVKSKSDLGRPSFGATDVVVSVLPTNYQNERKNAKVIPGTSLVVSEPVAHQAEKESAEELELYLTEKEAKRQLSTTNAAASDLDIVVLSPTPPSTPAESSVNPTSDAIEQVFQNEEVSNQEGTTSVTKEAVPESCETAPLSTAAPAVPQVVMENPESTTAPVESQDEHEQTVPSNEADETAKSPMPIPSSPVPWPSMPEDWRSKQEAAEVKEGGRSKSDVSRAVPEPVPTPTRSANTATDLVDAIPEFKEAEEKPPPRITSDSVEVAIKPDDLEGATESSAPVSRAPVLYTSKRAAPEKVATRALSDNTSKKEQNSNLENSAVFALQEATIVPLKTASIPDTATTEIAQISPVSPGAAASSSGSQRADSAPLQVTSSAVSLEGADSSIPKRPFVDEATAARLEAKMSGVTPSSLWKSPVTLPSDGTSSDLISGEDFLLTLGSTNSKGEAANSQGASRQEMSGEVSGLDLEPLVIPGQDEFSSVPHSPSQAFTPLAGVYYGISPPTTEPTSPENVSVSQTARRDYPEYEMLNGQLQDDSVAGSEPNTPILTVGSGWNEPFGDGMYSREGVGGMQKEGFEDRIPMNEVPEVLLHDWSGSTPIEPSVEIVDSAPNSRSSSSHLYSVIARPRVMRTELPNTALLMSTRMSVDKSKLLANRSDRADSAAFLPGQDEQGSSSSTAAVTKTGDFAGVVSTFAVSKGMKRRSDEKKSTENELSVPTGMVAAEGESSNVASNVAAASTSAVGAAATTTGWECSENEGAQEEAAEEGGQGDEDNTSKSKITLQPLPKVFPVDQKLHDFRQSTERKMFTETAYRRGGMSGRGMSFAEREREMETGGEEPSSDFLTYAAEAQKRESNRKRLAISPRRRRHSNLESGIERPRREDTHALRGVVGRLVSGMHLAKRLVTPN